MRCISHVQGIGYKICVLLIIEAPNLLAGQIYMSHSILPMAYPCELVYPRSKSGPYECVKLDQLNCDGISGKSS